MANSDFAQWLRDEHKTVKGLFRQITEEGGLSVDRESREAVLREIFMELECHSLIEEELLYPLLMEKAPDDNFRGRVDGCIQVHREIREVISRMRGMSIAGPDFPEGLSDLEDLVQAHVEEEEKVILPCAETFLGQDSLVRKMEQRKNELMMQPKYRFSRPKSVQNPNGGEQMRKPRGESAA